jgi:hypothetical protein
MTIAYGTGKQAMLVQVPIEKGFGGKILQGFGGGWRLPYRRRASSYQARFSSGSHARWQPSSLIGSISEKAPHLCILNTVVASWTLSPGIGLGLVAQHSCVLIVPADFALCILRASQRSSSSLRGDNDRHSHLHRREFRRTLPSRHPKCLVNTTRYRYGQR